MSKKIGDFHYIYTEVMDDNKKVLDLAIKEINRVYNITRSEYETDQRLGYTTARVVFGPNVYFTLSYGILDSGKDYERVLYLSTPNGQKTAVSNLSQLRHLCDGLRVPKKSGLKEGVVSRYLK